MGYALERREAVLKKMLPPNNRTIAALAREEGISAATLYGWRNAARREGRLMPDSDTTPQGWTSRDKFAAVLETATMSEAELAEYCRTRGLHTTQLAAWRAVCEQANDFESVSVAEMKSAAKAADKRERQLAKELSRKERALAEAAALLVLRGKLVARYGEDEDG